MQKSFGRRINKIRKEQGITSEALAVICGVNPVFIRQIEGGTRTPSLPVFVRICNALEMSPEYFLQDELKENPHSCDRRNHRIHFKTYPCRTENGKNIIQAMEISFQIRKIRTCYFSRFFVCLVQTQYHRHEGGNEYEQIGRTGI